MQGDYLYQLIKSMSAAEKRHFKIMVKKSGESTDSRYMELYHLLNEMKVFNKKTLKQEFPKNLPAFCRKLSENIFQSLRKFHSKKYNSIRIKQSLIDMRYLYERGLYEICNNKLDTVKKMAKEIDDQPSLMEINKFERQLFRFLKKEKQDTQELFKQSKREKTEILNKLEQEFNYFDIYDDLFTKVKEFFRLDEQGKKELKGKFNASLFEPENQPECANGERRFYLCGALYYQLLDKKEKVFFYLSKVVNWWTINSNMRAEAYYNYIIDLSNFLSPCFDYEDFDLAQKILEEIDVIYKTLQENTANNEHTLGVAFQKNFINWLRFHMLRNDFDIALELVPEIKSGLKKYEINPRSKLVLLYNVAVIYFLKEEFSNAREWVEKILKLIPGNDRKDIQRASLIFNVVIAFEIGEEILYDSKAVSKASYSLKKHFGLEKGDFEFTLLDYMLKISRSGLLERREKYIELRTFIENESSSNLGIADRIGLEELSLWLTHKIENRSIIDIIRDKD